MARTKATPSLKQEKKPVQDLEQEKQEVPELEQESVEVPEASQIRELPPVGSPENTIIVGGELIEIKPMKLKYQRNRTAAFYHVIELYPLPDILAMTAKQLGGRDGDKALCDWLVAVTDNEDFVRRHLDEFTTDIVYRMLSIFRRINKIDEMEEKLKNLKTPGTEAV